MFSKHGKRANILVNTSNSKNIGYVRLPHLIIVFELALAFR